MDDLYHPSEYVRIVTAASLFDGHDAAINIMRRLLQKGGAEIIHLGHNITAQKVADAAIQEDAHAICLSSYQGGHMEYFKYIRTILDENNAKHIKIFGGGGGVILPNEVKELHENGIEKIYTPEDGQILGLEGIISDVLKRSDYKLPKRDNDDLSFKHAYKIASKITEIEVAEGDDKKSLRDSLRVTQKENIPVLGITGTGGAGKSSLTDELLIRFLNSLPEIKIAIICVDPTRKKTGGALLGDRIRMNSLNPNNIFMRSMASRDSKNALSDSIEDALLVLKNTDFDLIIIETSGIGQGDTSVLEFCDCSLYVMTPEFGAQTQLEKIGMLDEADLIAINKLEKLGGEDALRDVKKQFIRNHDLPLRSDGLPIFGTTASQFNNEGVSKLFEAIYLFLLKKSFLKDVKKVEVEALLSKYSTTIIPAHRNGYLGEIAACIRNYHTKTKKDAKSLRYLYQLDGVISQNPLDVLKDEYASKKSDLDASCLGVLKTYDTYQENYRKDKLSYKVRNKELFVDLYTLSLAGTKIPKVALPRFSDWGDQYTFMNKENLPGAFPFTAGVFPFKRKDEDPKRQFAGEGGPKRTNKRFHYLCDGESSKRISTAFDSVTLYGEDPQTRPDIYGKIGESGVSVCSMQDMADLFAGFELIEPSTSVSMTINGPAPIILAMFLNTAISQQMKKRGISYDDKEYLTLKNEVLRQVRGTVQADILKEDQAQNTCIFSINFALKMMGDVQEYFTKKLIKNFYSVSISGYHIAEAGANPISQVAFTMSNGFTLVEAYLSRDLDIDEFAPNLSFFFSNGMDPEYSVIGRVARRIWAVAMRDKYGANSRSQKLKYHIQTSGRSLHAQEIQFNDIRTTLQALMAIYDNCNSLHTNAYDEAITTPTEESVRRAMAIQLIITKEMGLAQNENSLQGSFIIDELTDLVEEAILSEFERISRRGGVLGAMETQYQRSKIQEESMLYESRKSSGELPIIGVNTYLPKEPEALVDMAVIRASYDEKDDQINRLKEFHALHKDNSKDALKKLKEVSLNGENIFEELMETVKVCSLGEITQTLYQVGGEYRRSM
ncbi:MAG: methylmalonyl-CoA mutase [Candidatus Cloacimonadota bacterium]|nr:MAG: methylmalonyl-CoA mutase [Candidatus Cloacimonadota bacterium]